VALPEQLLLSDLLRRRVRCDQGLDHGPGLMGWMHPPVHRLLGWVTRPSQFGDRRQVWRLDQLRGLSEQEAFVKGDPTPTDPATLERLPTLLEASLLGGDGQTLGTVADAAVELRTGRIRHYLVARSDPRLPGGSRWRLAPDRIVDQQPGRVFTGLAELDDLPIAHASVRQELLRRSRHWRSRLGEETERLRRQVQEAGGRFEERVEGWLEEPPADQEPRPQRDWDREIWPEDDAPEPPRQPRPRSQARGRADDDDPWV
jgi:sporulation protein YlmC with PRC-barrel domain